MQYWLLKSEPNVWSIQQQQKAGYKGIAWDGVRNYQAANNLKKMKKKDLCFFYHTGKEKRIVGIVKVIKKYFKDKSDKTNKFVSVMVHAEDELRKPVTLKEIKNNGFFKELPLVKQSRLSVMKVGIKHWKKICKMGKMKRY